MDQHQARRLTGKVCREQKITISFSLCALCSDFFPITEHSGKAPQMFLLQFAVLLNQQSGKDTHIRQLKIFSTKE